MKCAFRGAPAFVTLLLAAARPAEAHIVAARLGDFYAGALHPLTDLQGVILWIGLGLLAGSMGAARSRWLVVIFPFGLLTGLMLATTFHIPAAGAMADAAATAALGLLIAVAARVPASGLGIIGVAIALMTGVATADGVAPDTNWLLFAGGLTAAGYAALTLLMAATLAFEQPKTPAAGGWRRIAVRACGSWIAAVGLMIGGLALAS